MRARVAHRRGDRALAWATVQQILIDGPATQPGASVFFPSMSLLHTAAMLALDEGDLATARAWLETHDRWLAWSDSVLSGASGPQTKKTTLATPATAVSVPQPKTP